MIAFVTAIFAALVFLQSPITVFQLTEGAGEGYAPTGALVITGSELPLPKNIWDNERSFGEASYAEVAEG